MEESAKRNLALIGERMKLFRESINLTQDQLASQIEGSKRGIQDNEWGKAAPNSKILIGLANLGLNINWLLLGEGEMLISRKTTATGDLNLFADAMEIIDLYLQRSGKTLTPEKKRKAVETLYRLSEGKSTIDTSVAEMIMQLAA